MQGALSLANAVAVTLALPPCRRRMQQASLSQSYRIRQPVMLPCIHETQGVCVSILRPVYEPLPSPSRRRSGYERQVLTPL
jgi:hypothetical protein